jgi:shikimate dehydrogenase
MKKLHTFALLGFPISHSLSPKIFELIGEYFEVDITYDLIELRSQAELENFLNNNFKSYDGVNLTTPLKNKTPLAKTLNVLKPNPLSGINTDQIAIEKLLRPYEQIINSVTLIGAGGAASAAVKALKTLKFIKHLHIINRSELPEKFTLAAHAPNWQVTSSTLEDAKKVSTDLLINATPMGLGGEVHPLSSHLVRAKIIFDMIYVPKNTNLIQQAERLESKTITGDQMLIEQAISSFEFWINDKIIKRDELVTFLRERLYE